MEPDVHPRLPRSANLRDVAGFARAAGVPMRIGQLYRAGDPSRLRGAARETFDALGIVTHLDLRAPTASRAKRFRPGPSSTVRHLELPLHDDDVDRALRRDVRAMLRAGVPDGAPRALMRHYCGRIVLDDPARLGRVLSALAEPDAGPALVHCTAGKDRTGLVVALLATLLGVPYDAVRADFLASNEALAHAFQRFVTGMRLVTLGRVPRDRLLTVLQVDGAVLDELFDTIHARHGSVEAYLVEAAELPAARLEALRRRLLG